ncbi:MAG: hypothetical protein WCP60_10765 [bacterium]
MILFLCSLLASTPFCCASGSASMWSGLSSQQQELLSSGKPLVIEESVSGNAWPRYTVYMLVKASSAQSAAVFWDCELDPKYVPDCLSVHLLGSPQPWIREAEYTLKMPMMLPNEVYVSRNEIHSEEIPGVYEISWNVLRASYIKGSTGNLRIEPFGNGSDQEQRSLLRYSNLVIPGSSIAGLLKSMARSEVIQSVKALSNQIEQERISDPQLLDHQLHEMMRVIKSIPKGK